MYGKTVSDLCFYIVLYFAYKIHYAYSLSLSPTPTFRKQRMEIQCSLVSVIAFGLFKPSNFFVSQIIHL